MSARRSCEDTTVPVERSRAAIAKILAAWGALGVQWEDDLETGSATLRFRWRPQEGGGEVIARLRLSVNISALRTPKNVTQLREQERRRLHRVAFHWLRSQHAAVESGLFRPETVLIPWLEDEQQRTIAEVLLPNLGKLATTNVGGRLMLGSGGR